MITIHILLAALIGHLVASLPQQANSGSSPGKAVFGSTYDEIVVETQLAVRPKVPGDGAGSRTGRAKAVFFRPSAGNGADVRQTRPTSTPTPQSSTTPSDGPSYAARVIGVVNPMARSQRAKRQWGPEWSAFRPQGFGSGFGGFGASSSQSSNQNFQFGPTGFSGGVGGSASQTYHLPTGDTLSVSFSNGFNLNPENGPQGSNSLALSLSGADGKNRTEQFFG